MSDLALASFEIAHGTHSVWVMGNRFTGNANAGFSDDWQQNRDNGLAVVARQTAASALVQMRPPQSGFGWVDLDRETPPTGEIVRTEGLITSNPEQILHANPADCGELAIEAVDDKGHPFIMLQHVGIRVVKAAAHIDALDYACNTRGVDATALTVRLAPSVRAASYAFATIEDELQRDDSWEAYVYQDEAGLWHKDVHGKTIADLVAFGVKPDRIIDHPADTAAEGSIYFSYTREKQGDWPVGCNALYFALR